MDATGTIREEAPGDRAAIAALLTEANLPVPAADDPPVTFVVAELDGEVAACCGWEIHEGGNALLRSVVVEASARSRGLGRRIVREALARLDGEALSSVTLVTLDADAFFAELGFRGIDRESVPASVQSSPEYSAHRCLGGHWMRLDR